VLLGPEGAAGGAIQHGVAVLPAEEHQGPLPRGRHLRQEGLDQNVLDDELPANRTWSASAADMDNNRPLYAGPEMPGAGQPTAARDPPEVGPGD
jgi:hypothetical protein